MSLSVSSDGTAIEGTPKDWMAYFDFTQISSTQDKRKQNWWDSFSHSLSATSKQIWDNRNFSTSLKEQLALSDSLIPDFSGNGHDKATGLTNWLGGGGTHKGWFTNTKFWQSMNPSDYLDTANVVTEGTETPYLISNLLSELKNNNPAAHAYILSKSFAKAKKIVAADDSGYSTTNNPMVNKTAIAAQNALEAAGKLPATILDAATGAIKTVDTGIKTASWFVDNIYWIIPTGFVVSVGTGYLLLKHHETPEVNKNPKIIDGMINKYRDINKIASDLANLTPEGRLANAAGTMGAGSVGKYAIKKILGNKSK